MFFSRGRGGARLHYSPKEAKMWSKKKTGNVVIQCRFLHMLLTQDKKRDSFTVAAAETGYPTNGQEGSPFKCKKGFTQLTDEINVVECSPEQTKTFDRDAL